MPVPSVEVAATALASGAIVLVIDDESRENEGDLVMAAEHTTPEALAFFLHHTSGLFCVATTGERLDKLEVPMMVEHNTEAHGTAFTVTVDLKAGTTTGISAHDRSATIRAIADPGTRPDDLARPGHVHLLRARPGGVLERAGHTEAAVELARLAGVHPSAVICEVTSADKLTMAARPELTALARHHGLPVVTVAELIEHVGAADSKISYLPAGRRALQLSEEISDHAI